MGGEVFLGRVLRKAVKYSLCNTGTINTQVMTVTSVIISIGYKHIVCNSQRREIHSTCS